MPGAQSYKLFIGNLDESTKAADIRPLFEKYGKVMECDVVKNYGFVHFQSENDAREATRELNGYVVNGNAIKVENAKSRRAANSNTTKIFVGNLTEKTRTAEVRALFEKFGSVLECDVIRNYGFVHLEVQDNMNINDAIRELNGMVVDGQALKVQVSTSRVRQKPGIILLLHLHNFSFRLPKQSPALTKTTRKGVLSLPFEDESGDLGNMKLLQSLESLVLCNVFCPFQLTVIIVLKVWAIQNPATVAVAAVIGQRSVQESGTNALAQLDSVKEEETSFRHHLHQVRA